MPPQRFLTLDDVAEISAELRRRASKQGKLELAKSAWQKALNFTSNAEEITRLKSKLNTKILK